MPGFDGTGPASRGPMTGRCRGFCVLRTSEDNPQEIKGFAGIVGMPVDKNVESLTHLGKEVTNMPRGNGTGPAGMGPMTGRAAGFCAGYPMPGYMNPVGGRGFWGGGRGGGWGRRNWFYATGLPGWARAGFGFSGPAGPTVTAEQELKGLKQQAEFLQNSLSQVSERIEQLEKESNK